MPKDIQQLIDGYLSFRKKYFAENAELFQELVSQGQQPNVMVVSCSDSRVDPSIILNCKPGDVFVVRNVANLVPPFEDDSSYHGTSAALEFAVCNLGIKHLIILGHSQCGGIRALLTNNALTEQKGFIATWIALAKNARNQVLAEYPESNLDEQAEICCEYAMLNSLNNLMSFPWIKTKVEAGELHLHAWYFDISTGKILAFDDDKQCFLALESLSLE